MSGYFTNRAGLLVPGADYKRELEEKGPEFLQELQKLIAEPVLVTTEIGTWHAFLALSAIQLTVSHPELGAALKDPMKDLGLWLQGMVTKFHPELAEMLEAGWHRELDNVREIRLPGVPPEEGLQDPELNAELEG